MMDKTGEILQTLEARVQKILTPKRAAHVMRVADTAVRLAEKYHLNSCKSRVAALGHDLCRELPEQEVLLLAEKDNSELEEWERDHPIMVHGRAAAVVLSRDFDIHDHDILEAVRWHTTGKKDLCDIGKIVYAADYLEPGRTHIDQSFRNDVDDCSLEQLVSIILNREIHFLEEKGLFIAPSTRRMYDSLKE